MALDYYEDGVQRVLRLMKDTFGDQFKQYFNGEVINLSEADLPCIMVTATEANVQVDATMTDMVDETVTVIVAVNKKDDLGGPYDTDNTDLRVRRLIMAQDASTGQYIPETVLYPIRKHITMQSDTLDSTIQINFQPNGRIGPTGDMIATQEGYVTIHIKRRIIQPQRD